MNACNNTTEQFEGNFSNEINFQEYDKHLEETNCLALYDLISNFLLVKKRVLLKINST